MHKYTHAYQLTGVPVNKLLEGEMQKLLKLQVGHVFICVSYSIIHPTLSTTIPYISHTNNNTPLHLLVLPVHPPALPIYFYCMPTYCPPTLQDELDKRVIGQRAATQVRISMYKLYSSSLLTHCYSGLMS